MFNCVQRGHQNSLENQPIFLAMFAAAAMQVCAQQFRCTNISETSNILSHYTCLGHLIGPYLHEW